MPGSTEMVGKQVGMFQDQLNGFVNLPWISIVLWLVVVGVLLWGAWAVRPQSDPKDPGKSPDESDTIQETEGK